MSAAVSRSRFVVDPGNPAQTALCLALGVGFTLALFLGMSHVGELRPPAVPADIADLRTVALPFQPPPPPQVTPAETERSVEVSTVTGFDLSPSDSPVKIAVSPPNLDELTPTIQTAPPAVIQIGALYGEFKPKLGLEIALRHVYQRSEVDTPPAALYRVTPSINKRMFHGATVLRLTLLFVVETGGSISNVRLTKSSGNPEVDAIVAETVQNDWGFSPAVKKGRKVRCLLEQPFRIELPRVSRFQQ